MNGLGYLWLALFAALLGLWATEVRRVRQPSGEPEHRPPVIAALVLLLLLLGGYTLGTTFAERGAEAIKASIATSAGDEGATGVPPDARARLFLDGVTLSLPEEADAWAVGYSADAVLHLPLLYGLKEAKAKKDVFLLRMLDKEDLAIEQLATGTATRIGWKILDKGRLQAARLLPRGGLSSTLSALLAGKACEGLWPDVEAASVVEHDHLVVLCDGARPKVLFVIESPLKAPEELPQLQIAPFVRRNGMWDRHHIEVENGMLTHMGPPESALPGMRTWDVPTPQGQSLVIYPPRNPLANCDQWIKTSGSRSAGFVSPVGLVHEEKPPKQEGFRCVLPYSAPFSLEVRRLIPDLQHLRVQLLVLPGVIGLPALVLLVIVAFRVYPRYPAAAVARACGLAVFAGHMAFLMAWRLLWAHRIDMLRDYESMGPRFDLNQTLAWLIAAALCGNATVVAVDVRPNGSYEEKWRLLSCFVAWGAVLSCGALFLQPEGWADGATLLQVLFSGVLASGIIWWPRVLEFYRDVVAVSSPSTGSTQPPDGPVAPQGIRAFRFTALLGSVVVVGVLATLFLDNPRPLRFLILLAMGPLAYSCFDRLALLSRTRVDLPDTLGSCFVLALLVATQLVGDPGMATMFGGPAIAVAAALALRDYAWRASSGSSGRSIGLRGVNQRGWFLLRLGAVAFGALLVVMPLSALGAAGSAEFPQQLTAIALRMTLVVIVGYLAVCVELLRRWGVPSQAFVARSVIVLLILFVVGAWAVAEANREWLFNELLAQNAVFSHRLGMIFEPAYTLLYNETTFAASLTGWLEASVNAIGIGRSYFGAQILDPGVRLSVDNDYLAVLILREGGAGLLALLAATSLMFAAAVWSIGGRHAGKGVVGRRIRQILAAVFAFLWIYQPLGALGLVPFTGISWPGMAIDSPTDFWLWALLPFLGCAWVDSEPKTPPSGQWTKDAGWASVHSLAIAALAIAAGALVVYNAGRFAEARQSPYQEGRLSPPFDLLGGVFEFIDRFQCPRNPVEREVDGSLVLNPPRFPKADVSALQRYERAYRAAWARDVAAASTALAERVAVGTCASGRQRLTKHWTLIGGGGRCAMEFKFGWPVYRFSFDPKKAKTTQSNRVPVECAFNRRAGFMTAALDQRPRRRYRKTRVRLVSTAMGDAARDVGELISDGMIIRLRGGAGRLTISPERAGVLASSVVRIGNLELEVSGGTVRATVVESARKRADASRVLLRKPLPAQLQLLRGRGAHWEYYPLAEGESVELRRMAVLLPVGDGRVWMFRPASAWGDAHERTVDPLLADDVTPVGSQSHRRYLYGGVLPQLGWQGHGVRMGIDGWARAAALSFSPGDGSGWMRGEDSEEEAYRSFVVRYCGTRRPPLTAGGGDEESWFENVCRVSSVDGVLECRTSIQPELQIRLRHLLETTSLALSAWRSEFALLKGDTGEILAHGDFTPGRESTAYGPRNATVEQYLIAAREKGQGPGGEETGAVKANWNEPIATGSTIKPLFAEAARQADPASFARLRFDPVARSAQACATSRSWPPLLGYCPPTASIWNQDTGASGPRDFLAHSYNWYQAGLGLVGLALPGGDVRFGSQGAWQPIGGLLQRAIRLPTSDRLGVRRGGSVVLSGDGRINVTQLRQTPLWTNLEGLIGRELCVAEGGRPCASDRMDLCGTRYLPIAEPSIDLRHLVALGPARFELEASDDGRPGMDAYFQLLRGSGANALASLLQLAASFNRVVYEPSGDGPHRGLAASWFPAPSIGRPPRACRSGGSADRDPVSDGLCDVLRRGTADDLASLLDGGRVTLFAAKTGTIDSLGGLIGHAKSRRSNCYRQNINRTLVGNRAQPYHLACGSRSARVSDKLFLISFGVRGRRASDLTPLTLALRYQRAPDLQLPALSKEFLELVEDYFS